MASWMFLHAQTVRRRRTFRRQDRGPVVRHVLLCEHARNGAADQAIVTASGLNEKEGTSCANLTLRVRHPRPLAHSTSTRRAWCVEIQAFQGFEPDNLYDVEPRKSPR